MVLKAQYVPKPPFGHFLLLSNFLWMSSSSYFSRRHNLAKNPVSDWIRIFESTDISPSASAFKRPQLTVSQCHFLDILTVTLHLVADFVGSNVRNTKVTAFLEDEDYWRNITIVGFIYAVAALVKTTLGLKTVVCENRNQFHSSSICKFDPILYDILSNSMHFNQIPSKKTTLCENHN